jgi:antitoxin component YwqK of YwqJK toxin-antitoxin module
MGLFGLFKKRNQDVLTHNGLNETYRKCNGGKMVIKERYYTSDGLKDGSYKSFYLDGETLNLQANFKDGKLDGDSRKWSIANVFGGGGCWRYIERYKDGEVRERKYYRCGGSSLLNSATLTRELVSHDIYEKRNANKRRHGN